MGSSGRGEAGGFSKGRRDRPAVTVPSEIAQNLKAEKPVLAYILKSALEEYAHHTVQEIAERFIEGKPEIRKAADHPDHPDREGGPGLMSGDDKVEGLPTADKSQRDGTVYYDIRFLASLPQEGGLAEILVNCEIQSDDMPGYPIPKRGIYYAARMISSQRGTTDVQRPGVRQDQEGREHMAVRGHGEGPFRHDQQVFLHGEVSEGRLP